MSKIKCGKTRPDDNPYEIWESKEIIDGTKWIWYVLKKYQNDDEKEYARAFCKVFTPACPNGELGDVYIKEIKENATLIKINK